MQRIQSNAGVMLRMVVVASSFLILACPGYPAVRVAPSAPSADAGALPDSGSIVSESDGGDTPDAGQADAGDAGEVQALDAGLLPDAGQDGGENGALDAGPDAGLDAGADAGPGAEQDAGLDGSLDGGEDGGLDAGEDAGFDFDAGQVIVDAGPVAVTYHIDNAHTGVIQDPTIQFPLSRLWQLDLGTPVSYPLIVNGRVYALFATISNGTYEAMLEALDGQTGTIVWGPVSTGPGWAAAAYDAGKVFVLDRGGTVHAFDAASGQILWNSADLTSVDGQWAFDGAPVAENGIVYVMGGGDGGTLYALSEQTGSVLWYRTSPYGGNGAPTVDASSVYISDSWEGALCYDARTGALRWSHYDEDGPGLGTMPLSNGRLYVQADDFDQAAIIGSAYGRVLARTVTGRLAAVTATTGYFLSRSVLASFDAVTGRTGWTFMGDGQLTTAPIVVNDTVLVGSSSGMLFGVDSTTGAEVWSADVGVPLDGEWENSDQVPLAALAAGNGLVVVPAGNTLSAFGSAPAVP